MSSILNDTKRLLGIEPDVTDFDQELILHINSVMMILTQLGVAPRGFQIADSLDEWEDMNAEIEEIPAVKTYVFLRVRKLFDPPTGGLLTASDETMKELEIRIKDDIEFNYEEVDKDEN